MDPHTLKTAIQLAEEFLRRAKVVPLEKRHPQQRDEYATVTPGKHAAAAKRASLDLTRALADLRRTAG